jgi:hypothetical protein
MTGILVRRVPDIWKRRLADEELAPDMAELPAWALGAFSPSEAEVDEISIYYVPDESRIVDLAAAWFAVMEKAQASTWAFVSEEAAAAAGLVWAMDGKGATASPTVNNWHAAVRVFGSEDLDRVVRLFAGGGVHSCEKKLTDIALERAVRSDDIILCAPNKERVGSNPFKKVPLWIVEGWVKVSGNTASHAAAIIK